LSDSNNPLVAEVLEWLPQSALRVTTIGDILMQTCERLVAAGIPLWRVHLADSTLHPLIASQSSTWTRDGGLESEEHAHGLEHDGWLRSPLKLVIDRELPFFRRHLRGAGAIVNQVELDSALALQPDWRVLASCRNSGTSTSGSLVRAASGTRIRENAQDLEHDRSAG
jgi:hypothetical protein